MSDTERLGDVVVGTDGRDGSEYRALVHPDDLDDLDALLELADIDDVHAILQVGGADGAWRLVEHRPVDRRDDGATVLARWDVTGREQARQRASETAAYWQTLLRNGHHGIAVVDPDHLRIRHVSDELASLLGYRADELVGRRALWHVDRRDLPILRDLIADAGATPPGPLTAEIRLRDHGGQPHWMELSVDDRSNDRDVGALVVSVREIESRKQAEEHLRSSEHLFRVLVQHVADGAIVVDGHNRMVFLSTAAAHALGGSVEDLRGEVVPLIDDGAALQLVSSVGDEHVPPMDRLPAEVCNTDGRWFDVVGHDLTADPVVGGWLLVLRDVTDRRGRVERLRRELELDPLTGLLNRRGFEARVGEHLAQGSTIGLGFIDLDGFKAVNDSHGHLVGDAMLVEVAARLRRGVRPSDAVGRFGGDEFAIAFVDLPNHAELIDVTTRLVETTRGGYEIDGHTLTLGVSAGWTMVGPGDSVEDALRRADQRMYAHKRQRR